jgi:signal transduction histidine kinase
MGGIVKAEGLGDGPTHGTAAIANPCLRRGDVIPAQAGIRLTMPPIRLDDFALVLQSPQGTRARRLTLLGEMASGFAHELNQPLSAVLSYASALLRMIESQDAEMRLIRFLRTCV